MIVNILQIVIEYNNLLSEKENETAEKEVISSNEENRNIILENPDVIRVGNQNSINQNRYSKFK